MLPVKLKPSAEIWREEDESIECLWYLFIVPAYSDFPEMTIYFQNRQLFFEHRLKKHQPDAVPNYRSGVDGYRSALYQGVGITFAASTT